MQKSSYYMLLPGFQLCQWIGFKAIKGKLQALPSWVTWKLPVGEDVPSVAGWYLHL